MKILCALLCFFGLLLFDSSLATTPSQLNLTLENFLQQVREENPTVRSAILRAESAYHRIEPAGALDDPFVALGVDQMPFGEGMGSVTRYQVSQSFPFPGKRSNKLAIAEGKAKASQSDAETIQREAIVLATQAFFRTYYNQKAIELNSKLKVILEGAVGSAKARYKTGEVGHHDWLLGQVEFSIIDIERLKLLRERRTLQAVLNELRNETATARIPTLTVQFTNQEKKKT